MDDSLSSHKNLEITGAALFALDAGPLTLDALDSALCRPVLVTIADPVWSKIEASAARCRKIAGGDEPAYGINTGFGNLCTKRIGADEVEALQYNLIVSHAVGVGDVAPDGIVRWMMLFKIKALTHGVSGVSKPTIECLIRMLEHDILPVIPTKGSLGASGDLAPLAHMVLPMLGLGEVTVDGTRMPAPEAFAKAKIKPVTLGPKEGLGLINGTQFMCSYAATILVRARRLIKHADIIAAMTMEGTRASIMPCDARLHALRPHPGAIETAENIIRLMANSEILESHANCLRVQDPYSIRCVPQVHGAIRDAIRHAADVVEREINSVTDNPLIFDNGDVISGGSFHGEPLALVLDYLAMALSELASISERRTYLMLSGIDELPTLLMENTGINSGFMITQYTAAALVNENKVLASPACVDSIPTSLGQEDHVSMGATSATKCARILENVETVLAIEMMCAAQAMDFRLPLEPGIGPRAAHAQVRQVIAHAEKDGQFGQDIQASLKLLRDQEVLRAVLDQLKSLH